MLRVTAVTPYLRAAGIPLAVLVLVTLLQIASAYGFIPSQAYLMDTIVAWVSTKGAPAIMVVSLLENTAVLNTYFPGAIAILSAMALTHDNPAAAVQIWLAITGGALAGQSISYLIGRTAKRFQRSGTTRTYVFWATYWHPYTSSFTALRAASQGMPFVQFALRCLPAVLVWNLFWGISMYIFGNFLGGGENFVRLIILYLIGWAILTMVQTWRAQHLHTNPQKEQGTFPRLAPLTGMNPRAFLSLLLAFGLFGASRAHELFGIGRSVGAMALDAPTFATPAPYAFLIWPVIFTLWTLMAIQQARPSQTGTLLWRRIGWPMAGAMATAIGWMLTAVLDGNGTPLLLLILAMDAFLMVALGRTVISLQTDIPPTPFHTWVTVPGLSIAAGWLTLATFLNLAGVLQLNVALPTSTPLGAIATLLAALVAGIAGIMLLRHHPVAVQGYAFAMVWGLAAVTVANSGPGHSAIGLESRHVAITAMFGAVVVLMVLAFVLHRRRS